MEEACAENNLEEAKRSFMGLLLSWDERESLEYRFVRGGLEVVRRSTYLAAQYGHISILSFLLEQGMQIRSYVSGTLLAANRREFCQALFNSGWAPKIGTQDIINLLSSETSLRFFLDHGWNPNLYNEQNSDCHPLTTAASTFPPSIVRILLKHGVSSQGTMALHAAVAMAVLDPSRYEVLDLLLSYGADINEMELDPKARRPRRPRTSFTGTPLHHALHHLHQDFPESASEPSHGCYMRLVKYLLDRGASPTAPSWSGRTALQVAEGECEEAVELMRKRGSLVDKDFRSSLLSYDKFASSWTKLV